MEERTVLCPACGAEMVLKQKEFSIGADGGGGLLTLLAKTYMVDLYACPQCGKVELYTANFRKQEEQPEKEPEETEEPGESKEPEPAEPKDGGGFFGLGKRKGKRPPWEK